jgi:broad specificity phosphatase PhoE
MTTIFIARHGQTDWNAEHRWQGHADPPLNERGRSEAQALAASLALRGIEAIYSSDLARARETAEIVGARLGLPVVLDARLREVDVGEWSGLTTPEIEQLYPGAMGRRREGMTGWTAGEEMEAMARRVMEALLAIVEGVALVVTHGGPLRYASAFAGSAEGWVTAGNCDVDVFAVEAGGIRWLDSTRGGLHQQVQG